MGQWVLHVWLMTVLADGGIGLGQNVKGVGLAYVGSGYR